MSTVTLLSFAAAMFILAASPGPGVFATVARALASGFSHAAVLILGIVTGDLVFLLLAVYGLSTMAAALGSFFVVVKYGGGLYLIWLGISLWRSPAKTHQTGTAAELTCLQNYFSGLSITLANPKVILFYLGFLPGFVNLEQIGSIDVLLISIIVFCVLGSVLLGYAWTATMAGQLFASERTVGTINRSAGSVMIAAGCAVMFRD